MMHRLTALRRAQQEARQRHDGLPPVRPIFTGTARKSFTPSDLEALETVSISIQNADGSFPFLAGYDDVPAYP